MSADHDRPFCEHDRVIGDGCIECDDGDGDDDRAGSDQPDIFDLISELRREVGLFDGAMPITPKQAWDEAIERVRALRNAVVDQAIEDYRRTRV